MRTAHVFMTLCVLLQACSSSAAPEQGVQTSPPSGTGADPGASASTQGSGNGHDSTSPPSTGTPPSSAPSSSPLRRRLVVDDATVTFVRKDGAIFRWGQHATANGSATPVRHDLTDAIAVAVSDSSSQTTCSLRADGTVQCASPFGDRIWDVDNLTDAVGLAVTGRTFCALRKDKTVACFQANGFDPLVSIGVLGNVQSLDVVGDASVEQSGTLVTFKLCGVVAQGITCMLHTNDAPTLIPGTAGAKDVVHVDGGRLVFRDANDHVMAYEDGTDYPNPPGIAPVPAFANVAAARIERFGDCVVTSAGEPRCQQEIPASIKNVVEIGLGYDFGCALTTAEKVLCWGKNDFGQLGVGSYIEYTDAVEALVP